MHTGSIAFSLRRQFSTVDIITKQAKVQDTGEVKQQMDDFLLLFQNDRVITHETLEMQVKNWTLCFHETQMHDLQLLLDYGTQLQIQFAVPFEYCL